MNLAFRCDRCDKTCSVTDRLAGRKMRCPACGHIQRMSMPPDGDRQSVESVYPVVEAPLLTTTQPSATAGRGGRERTRYSADGSRGTRSSGGSYIPGR